MARLLNVAHNSCGVQVNTTYSSTLSSVCTATGDTLTNIVSPCYVMSYWLSATFLSSCLREKINMD